MKVVCGFCGHSVEQHAGDRGHCHACSCSSYRRAAETLYTTGDAIGTTIFRNGEVIGAMITPELARAVAGFLNTKQL